MEIFSSSLINHFLFHVFLQLKTPESQLTGLFPFLVSGLSRQKSRLLQGLFSSNLKDQDWQSLFNFAQSEVLWPSGWRKLIRLHRLLA